MNNTPFTPAAVTGQPMFSDDMQADLTWRDQQNALAYSLDAPELILVGGIRAVVIMGDFEGVTPRTAFRGEQHAV